MDKSTNTNNNNNAMKNYELLIEHNKILNELLDKVNNLDLNIQYIFTKFKENEKEKELEKSNLDKSGWFY
ncbi:MAG: hypothetical protein CML17_06875 [Pusillimonas sp.]|jgi:hypothetical protein|nr:hypothetical protein [Pusillimonas sp.]|tara:strand:- start:180 stop:389 length:210 start_codon:yes stop_codon:yes gene_type:complete